MEPYKVVIMTTILKPKEYVFSVDDWFGKRTVELIALGVLPGNWSGS